MILCDSSQAPSTVCDYPEEFEKEENVIKLGEVVRSLPILTKATMLFQRYHQDETTNHLDKEQKNQGLRPRVRLFKSTSIEEDYKSYARLVIEEILNVIKKAFADENLHNTAAIIVPDNDARSRLLEVGGLRDQLEKIGFCAVTALEASKRLSNHPPANSKEGHVIVDTIANMNGLERLFVIIVDMDKPLEKIIEEKTEAEAHKKEEMNQKNLSEIYCACTRGMLHVIFINKYISNGWMSFFNFTESEASSSGASARSDVQGKLDNRD